MLCSCVLHWKHVATLIYSRVKEAALSLVLKRRYRGPNLSFAVKPNKSIRVWGLVASAAWQITAWIITLLWQQIFSLCAVKHCWGHVPSSYCTTIGKSTKVPKWRCGVVRQCWCSDVFHLINLPFLVYFSPCAPPSFFASSSSHLACLLPSVSVFPACFCGSYLCFGLLNFFLPFPILVLSAFVGQFLDLTLACPNNLWVCLSLINQWI